MDVARDEVRVMTVHGAKGLEAKVVVVADTCGAPDGRHDPRLFAVQDPASPDAAPPLIVWSTGQQADPPCVVAARTAIREAADAEHRRLLYVALTRAAGPPRHRGPPRHQDPSGRQLVRHGRAGAAP